VTKPISANVDDATFAVLDRVATDEDRTKSAQIARVLRQWAETQQPADPDLDEDPEF
jgi:predicted transcriptional regulator